MEQPITPPPMITVSAVELMIGPGVGDCRSGLGLEGGAHIPGIQSPP